MTSNQDILAFLKSNQEALAQEKEDDRRSRAIERQEDREKILEMIKIGVKNEIKAATRDLELKLEQQEKVNKDLAKELEYMAKEMEVLRVAVNNQSDSVRPRPSPPSKLGERGELVEECEEQVRALNEKNCEVMSDEKAEPDPSLSKAKRTLGFQCIYPEDVERQFRKGARSENEARLMAFKEFTESEL